MTIAVTYENGEVFQHLDIQNSLKFTQFKTIPLLEVKLCQRTEAATELWPDF